MNKYSLEFLNSLQARSAAALIRTTYERTPGKFDLAKLVPDAPHAQTDEKKPDRKTLSNFAAAFVNAAWLSLELAG